MKDNILKTTFTEEEAINITIKHGYDGAEFETSVWKQRGCLKPNGTLKTLISKLETIYNHVEVTGNGKKRKYILKDKKEQVTERKFNYKGSVATVEEEIMKEYIFNRISSYENDISLSYKSWAKLLGFYDTESLSIDEMIEAIKELHFGFPMIYNPKEVVSKFIQTLVIRNKDVIEKSFQRLEKENRISVSEIYYFKTTKGEYEEVDKNEYDEAQEYLKKFLEAKDVTYYAYSQSITSIHNSKKMKQIIKEVEKYLSEQFNIEYFFKAFKVTVLDPTIQKEVTNDEFNQAYFQRLIKLSKDRQNKKDYKNSIYFWKRFYLLNTLTLIKYVTGIDELLKEEKRLYSDKKDNFALDVMTYYFELDIEREKRRHAFGNN